MFAAAAPAFGLLLTLSASGASTAAQAQSEPVQFVLPDAAMRGASAASDELIITAAVRQPYLSSIEVGEFEASGEIAAASEGADAAVILYAAVDGGSHTRGSITIALPALRTSGWQPMTISSLDNHVRVSISGRVVGEADVDAGAPSVSGPSRRR